MQLFGKQSIENRQQRNRYTASVRAYARFLLKENKSAAAKKLLLGSLTKYTPDDPQYIETYLFLGEISEKTGDNDKALNYYQKSLKFNETAKNKRSAAKAYAALGQLLHKTGKQDEAIQLLQKSLAQLNDNFESGVICSNPNNIDATRNWQILFKVLSTKVSVLSELSKKDKSFISCAKSTYSLANELLNKMRAINVDPVDRQSLTEKNYHLFEAGIKLNLEQKEIDIPTAFTISEQSKANTLLSAINDSYVQDYNIPNSIILAEQDIQDQLRTAQAAWAKEQQFSVSVRSA